MRSQETEQLKPRTMEVERGVFSPSTFPQKDRSYMCSGSALFFK